MKSDLSNGSFRSRKKAALIRGAACTALVICALLRADTVTASIAPDEHADAVFQQSEQTRNPGTVAPPEFLEIVRSDPAIGIRRSGIDEEEPIRTATVFPARLHTLKKSLDRGKTMRGLNSKLLALIYKVEEHFGRKIVLVSGCRSYKHNRKVGGARKSFHLKCQAADFYIPGVSKSKLLKYVRSMGGTGGIGSYCSSRFIHLDVGPKRSWHWKCRRSARKKKK